jgi:hypothetical protein
VAAVAAVVAQYLPLVAVTGSCQVAEAVVAPRRSSLQSWTRQNLRQMCMRQALCPSPCDRKHHNRECSEQSPSVAGHYTLHQYCRMSQ